jgi:hypothetical protein
MCDNMKFSKHILMLLCYKFKNVIGRQDRTNIHCLMTLAYCKFKLQTRNFHKTRSLISHLDACTSMEHANRSYCTHNILNVIHTLG